MRTLIKVERPADFFKRGKLVAKLADQGKAIPREHIIAFEGPQDMARLITTAKLALFREVRQSAGSITELAERLHRDRSAVKRDIDELEKAGLIEVQDMPLPGHGRKKRSPCGRRAGTAGDLRQLASAFRMEIQDHTFIVLNAA